MSNAQAQAEPKYDETWLARPIGLGLPTKRFSAFNALRPSSAPTPNPYLAAERRQQAEYRAAAARTRPAIPAPREVCEPEATAAKINAVLLSWPFGLPEQRTA